jgi:hypothetical protein
MPEIEVEYANRNSSAVIVGKYKIWDKSQLFKAIDEQIGYASGALTSVNNVDMEFELRETITDFAEDIAHKFITLKVMDSDNVQDARCTAFGETFKDTIAINAIGMACIQLGFSHWFRDTYVCDKMQVKDLSDYNHTRDDMIQTMKAHHEGRRLISEVIKTASRCKGHIIPIVNAVVDHDLRMVIKKSALEMADLADRMLIDGSDFVNGCAIVWIALDKHPNVNTDTKKKKKNELESRPTKKARMNSDDIMATFYMSEFCERLECGTVDKFKKKVEEVDDFLMSCV